MIAAGCGAGFVNAVVGSGSLITFPTLLAVGYPPVTANVSNNIGLVPGSVAGALGYDNPAAFTTMFKRALGVPPRAYLRDPG